MLPFLDLAPQGVLLCWARNGKEFDTYEESPAKGKE